MSKEKEVKVRFRVKLKNFDKVPDGGLGPGVLAEVIYAFQLTPKQKVSAMFHKQILDIEEELLKDTVEVEIQEQVEVADGNS